VTSSGAPGPGGPTRRAALLALFLVSGATALVYEVSWTRRLVLLVGSTAAASALLLAAWMLGLALGARLGGPPADRSRRPLRMYAVLEAGAAIAAFLIPPALDGLLAVPALTAAGREGLLLGIAFLVILVPTTLLGATLPALAREVVDDPSRVAPRVGALYAANTLGAVAGALLAGFALVEALGVDGSARAAAVASLLVAAAAWMLGGREKAAGAGAAAGAAEGATAEAPAPAASVVRWAAAAAFAGGFVGLAAEVAWTRLLVFSMQGFTAAFAAMLGAFLLGSALGGAAFGRAAGRARAPLALLGWLLLAGGTAAAGTLAVLSEHFSVMQALRGPASIFGSARANHHAALLAAAFVAMGPPAFLLGGVFPAAARAATAGLGDLGARLGRLYAANTVGAVAGSLAAGFLGVPLLGARGTAAVAAAIAVAAGIALLAASRRAGEPAGAGRVRAIGVGGLAGAAVLLVVLGRPGEPMILRSQVFLGARGRENVLVESREGRAGLASVVRNERNDFLSLYTDEFLAASSEGRYRYMRMLGHIPMVLAEDPRRVLVMAFGTGTTAGSLSTHPSVERLDVVEISPEVLALAPHFATVNRGVLDRAGKPGRPEVRVFVDDARRFVLGSRDAYDVITLEPLLPYTPGAVHLYTREFYELCRARLAPGGAVCQWFPIHALSPGDFRLLAAAFVEVFPESSLWFVEETAALVGTTGPGPQGVPVARSAERLSAPGPREDLRAGRLDDLAQWWSFRVCGGAALRDWTRGVEGMTDERPVLEFRPMPSFALTTYLHDNLVQALDLRDRDPVEKAADLAGLPAADAAAFRARLAAAAEATAAYMDGRAGFDRFSFHASHTRMRAGPAETARHLAEAESALRTAVLRYGAALRANPRDRIVAEHARNVEFLRLLNEGRVHLREGRADAAADAYARAAATGSPWNADEAWTGLGRALLRLRKPVGAREALEKSLSLYPGGRDAQAFLGEALVALGRPGEARAWFARAWEGGGGPSDEDPETLSARAAAEAAEAGAGGGLGSGAGAGGGDEARRGLVEALEDAAGGPGPRRDRAVAMLRAARERDARTLDEVLEPFRRTAADPAQPAIDRVRALGVLGAAAPPWLGEVVGAVARGAGADAALATAALDAAAAAGDAEALAAVLRPAGGAPPAVRGAAADRLASIRQPEAVDAALDGLGDPDEKVREAALAALFRLTGMREFEPAAAEPERAAAIARLRDLWSRTRPAWR
jgi:spermidine synthase